MSLAKVLAFFEGAFHPNASVAAHVPEGAWSDLAADAAGQDGPAAEAIAAAVVTPSAGGNVHVQLPAGGLAALRDAAGDTVPGEQEPPTGGDQNPLV